MPMVMYPIMVQSHTFAILHPFQGIRRTHILRRTLTIKIEQQNLDYIIYNKDHWIRIE
jgi:hypothetical protein